MGCGGVARPHLRRRTSPTPLATHRCNPVPRQAGARAPSPHLLEPLEAMLCPCAPPRCDLPRLLPPYRDPGRAASRRPRQGCAPPPCHGLPVRASRASPLKASRPLIRVLVINDNVCGLTISVEMISIGWSMDELVLL